MLNDDAQESRTLVVLVRFCSRQFFVQKLLVLEKTLGLSDSGFEGTLVSIEALVAKLLVLKSKVLVLVNSGFAISDSRFWFKLWYNTLVLKTLVVSRHSGFENSGATLWFKTLVQDSGSKL
jgi:hypothetical protein